MREFFRGRRRLTGCVTLALACVLTQAWLRSTYRHDSVGFWFFGRWSIIESNHHYLNWGAEVPSSILWRVWSVPYWSIVIPLTLLSAYLILWKPRKRPTIT